MKKIALTLFLFALSAPYNAHAGSKWTYWNWPPGHFENQTFQPHINDPKTPHNSQWDAPWGSDPWSPENWVRDSGSIEQIIDDFYRAGIITDQDEDNDIPVLVVGDAFMHLSDLEKQRVSKFIDFAFGITEENPDGLFYIYYDRTKRFYGRGEPIGVYTARGLSLQ